ncbi:MAG: tryptophan synthase subunit alpha [Candidatus Limnocylindrales bacterium]
MTRDTTGGRRIESAFAAARAAGRIAFVPYVVAGYPSVEQSYELAVGALDGGADLLEIGLPYSDPLADGVTLQRAGDAALSAGMTLDAGLALAARVAAARPDKPILVMGYANQFLGPRGADAVAQRLADGGAAGAIVADLPPDEGAPLEDAFARNGLALVYLVAPTSSDSRIELIASRSGGFVYCVSLAGVTGARSDGPTNLAALVARVKSVSPLPVAVGFGVSRPEHVRAVAASGADGVIVGSALVDALGRNGTDFDRFDALCRDLATAA